MAVLRRVVGVGLVLNPRGEREMSAGAEQPSDTAMQARQEYRTTPLNRIYYPEDRLPLVKLIPMGIQHVIAMFGGTVLADPRVTLFFSGIGTLLFVFVTGLRVPSYLGSSFAFIGPILAITGGNASRIPYALCGVAGAAVLYAAAGRK